VKKKIRHRIRPGINQAMSRREFIKKSGKTTACMAVGAFLLNRADSPAFAVRERAETCGVMPVKYELRFDPKKCAGCGYCEISCAGYHEGDAGETERNRLTLRPVFQFAGLSALSANASAWPQPLSSAKFGEYSTNKFCRQCASPECLDACPEDAISVDPKTGARVVDESLCVGCGACVGACQWGMIHLDPDREKAYKCDFCGGRPQCAAWCPTGAITFHRIC